MDQSPEPVINNLTPPPKKPLIPIIITLLFLASSALAVYFYLQTQTLKRDLAQTAVNDAPPSGASPTSVSDATADWQTYTDKNQLFSFSYPKEFAFTQERSETVSISNRLPPDPSCTIGGCFLGTPRLTIAFDLYKTNAKLEDFAQERHDASFNFDPSTSPISQSTLNGQPIYEYSFEVEGFNIYKIIKISDSYGLIISNSYPSKEEVSNYQPLADQILSTFKFTDSQSSTTTKFNDGYISFDIPNELKITKDFHQTGVPYAQLQTKIPSSIQLDLGSELEIQCVNTINTDTLNINGKSVARTTFEGIPSGQLENCQTDNSQLRAEWLRLPINIPNIGQITLAIRYELQDELQAQSFLSQILSTLKF